MKRNINQEWLSELAEIEIEPCKFCRRVFLAGICCEEARQEARKKAKTNETDASEDISS